MLIFISLRAGKCRKTVFLSVVECSYFVENTAQNYQNDNMTFFILIYFLNKEKLK